MIIKISLQDRELLKEQLLKLIKENESDLSQASDEDIQSGTATFYEDFSVNQALMKRAISLIRNTMSTRINSERYESYALMAIGNDQIAKEDEERKLDSIGPELLERDRGCDLPF